MVDLNIETLIETYFIVGIAILFIFTLYDAGLHWIQGKIHSFCYDLKRKLLYNPTILIYIFKTESVVYRFIHLIRFNWVTVGSSDDHDEKLYKLIYGGTIKSLIYAIAKFLLFSRFALLTLGITLLWYFKMNIYDVIKYIMDVNELLKIQLYINSSITRSINDFLILLPSIIIIITILISAYFVSVKYKYHFAINQANKDRMVDLAKIHMELSRLVANMVYEGSKNLDRALEIVHKKPDKFAIKDMIVENRMINICPYIESIRKDKVEWGTRRNYSYRINDDIIPAGFHDIDSIDKIADILKKAKSEGYYYSLGRFRILNRKLINITNYKLCSQSWVKQLLFTEAGLKDMIEKANKNASILDDLKESRPIKDDMDYYSELLIREKEDFSKWLDDNIVSGIELLINLSKYVEATNKVFSTHSRKWTDIIGQIVGFNK